MFLLFTADACFSFLIFILNLKIRERKGEQLFVCSCIYYSLLESFIFVEKKN